MGHWIGWNIQSLINIFSAILLFIIAIKNKSIFVFSKINIWGTLMLFFAYMYVQLGWKGDIYEPSLYTQIVAYGLPALYIISLEESARSYVFRNITRWFAVMLVPSIALWVITGFMDIPSLGMVQWTTEDTSEYGYGIAQNYIFFIKPIVGEILGGRLARFCGPFLEPGHLGMMCAFILYANNLDFKDKYNRIIAISLLFTLSLSGYLLLIVGFFFTRYKAGKLNIGRMFFYILLLQAIVFVGQNYNGGDNPLNTEILARFESDEDKGFVGNNRNSLMADYLFLEMLDKPKLLMTGYESKYIESLSGSFDTKVTGTGIVILFVKRGLIGFLLAISFYLFTSLKTNNKQNAYMAFIFFLLLFIQRCYFMWYAWVICYLITLKENNQNK